MVITATGMFRALSKAITMTTRVGTILCHLAVREAITTTTTSIRNARVQVGKPGRDDRRVHEEPLDDDLVLRDETSRHEAGDLFGIVDRDEGRRADLKRDILRDHHFERQRCRCSFRNILARDQHQNGLRICVEIVFDTSHIVQQREASKEADTDCSDKDECSTGTYKNLVGGEKERKDKKR